MRFSFTSMLFAAILGSSAATAQTFATKPFLSVQGHAEAKVTPDLFPVTVTLKETGMDPAKSQGFVESLAARVLEAAKAQGGQDKDIDVGKLSVSPETKWKDDDETEVFLGNTYEREIEVRFRDLEALRRFIAALPDQKQVRIETGEFEYSDRRALQRKLRREAIADAKAAAEEMADAVGKRLVELFNVSDRSQSTIYSNQGFAGGGLDSVTVYGSSVQRRTSEIVLKEGEITISADAYLVYIIGD
jgi:uncharacterized protein YggE